MKEKRLQTFESSCFAVHSDEVLHSYADFGEKSYTDGLIEGRGENIIKHTRFYDRDRPIRTDAEGLSLLRQLLKKISVS